MFERCLFCERAFPQRAFERFPCGRRVAYDPGRERLWSICDHCHRWNLCPDDERREAIYAFERLARDEGYVVAKTANAALLRIYALFSNKPPFTQLFTDDQARLWVGRTVTKGEAARWDVFNSDGEFLAVIRGPAAANQYMQPVVVGDRIHMIADGEAGERYIVVAELPQLE